MLPGATSRTNTGKTVALLHFGSRRCCPQRMFWIIHPFLFLLNSPCEHWLESKCVTEFITLFATETQKSAWCVSIHGETKLRAGFSGALRRRAAFFPLKIIIFCAKMSITGVAC